MSWFFAFIIVMLGCDTIRNIICDFIYDFIWDFIFKNIWNIFRRKDGH